MSSTICREIDNRNGEGAGVSAEGDKLSARESGNLFQPLVHQLGDPFDVQPAGDDSFGL
jgi:hypothetical protein